MTDQPIESAAPSEAGPERESLTIREFQADDIDGLFFLEQRCYEAPFSMTYPQLRSLLKDPTVATLVVVGEVTDGEGAGVPRMVAALIVKPEAEQGRLMILSLNVDPDYRRLGLGRRLAARARIAAENLKLPAAAMPVEAENTGGTAFLQAMGYAPAEVSQPYFVGPEDGQLWCLAIGPQESP